MKERMMAKDITGTIIDVAIYIHRKLGPGLLESAYQAILAHELNKRGLHVQAEVGIPLKWDGKKLDLGSEQT